MGHWRAHSLGDDLAEDDDHSSRDYHSRNSTSEDIIKENR